MNNVDNMKKYCITDEEMQKLKFVISAIDSNDIETRKLAIGLLKTFSPNLHTFSYHKHQRNISKISLGALIYQYEVVFSTDNFLYYMNMIKYLYIKDQLMSAIKNIIRNKSYYI